MNPPTEFTRRCIDDRLQCAVWFAALINESDAMNKQKLDNEASLSPELRHHRHNATALIVYYSKPIGIIELHGAPFSMAITLRRQGGHAARSAPVHGKRKTPPHNPRQKEKTKKERRKQH